MKMLSPALSVLRHAPRASSVLCGCSPRLNQPSLHLHPQSHLSRLVLPPRPTPRTLMSISDPPRSSSSSLASSPVVGLADPGRRPSCCSTQRAALLYSQTRLLLFGSELDSPSPAPPRPRPRRLLLERPDAPGALCRPRGTLLLLSVQSAAAFIVSCSPKMHRRPVGGSSSGSPTRENAAASSSTAAAPSPLPLARISASRYCPLLRRCSWCCSWCLASCSWCLAFCSWWSLG